MENNAASGTVDVPDGHPGPLAAAPERFERAGKEWAVAVDLMPQVMCILDAGGHVLRLNRTAGEWGLNTARGLTLHQLLHPGCADEHCELQQFWTTAALGLRHGCRASRQVDDARLGRHIEIVLRPVRRTRIDLWRGKRLFAIAQIEDISAARRAELELERQNSELNARLRLGNDQLKQAYEQLRQLSAQLVNIQEQERQRIAAELHDGIGQSLSIIKFGMEDAQRRLAAGALDESRTLLATLDGKLANAIDEVRQITLDLRPSILDDFGIVATISWFVREFRWFYRDIAVETEIGVAEADVPDALKTAIYRILQEAMNNIARHTRTARVRVRLGIRQNTLELAIEDSGAGFDVTKIMARTGAGKGYGLISMRDRALLSGGNFRIDSLPGQGTLIRVGWPVERAGEATQ